MSKAGVGSENMTAEEISRLWWLLAMLNAGIAAEPKWALMLQEANERSIKVQEKYLRRDPAADVAEMVLIENEFQKQLQECQSLLAQATRNDPAKQQQASELLKQRLPRSKRDAVVEVLSNPKLSKKDRDSAQAELDRLNKRRDYYASKASCPASIYAIKIERRPGMKR